MENNYYSPVQILENNIKAGINKANMGLLKMILLGMFAGMFIAIGAEGSNLADHNLIRCRRCKNINRRGFPDRSYDVSCNPAVSYLQETVC